MRLGAGLLMALLTLTALGDTARASATAHLIPRGMRVERIVMLYRHGLRAPLDGEAAVGGFARQAWPVWTTAPSLLTPHGREGVRQLGLYDRAWLAPLGLAPAHECPRAGSVRIWTNSEARTIASGEELAEGFAPGCELTVGHRAPGVPDPLFDATAAAPRLDATEAVEAIKAATGGPAALVAPYTANIHAFETILGCRASGQPDPCDIAAIPSTLSGSADGHGLALGGPIQLTSGAAEVLLIEYAEGMPMGRVGWGRATPARLAEASRLHAILFDVFDRSPYMAHRTAAAIGPQIVSSLTSPAQPRVSFFVGHDNNIAALTSLLGAHFRISGYGLDDPPIGGGLAFLLLRDAKSGARDVRIVYQAQTLDQLRALSPLTRARPPALQILTPRCAEGPEALCSVPSFAALLQ